MVFNDLVPRRIGAVKSMLDSPVSKYRCHPFALPRRRSDKQPDRVEIAPEQLVQALWYPWIFSSLDGLAGGISTHTHTQ